MTAVLITLVLLALLKAAERAYRSVELRLERNLEPTTSTSPRVSLRKPRR